MSAVYSSGCVAAEIKTVVFRVCTDAYVLCTVRYRRTDGVPLSLLIVPYGWFITVESDKR